MDESITLKHGTICGVRNGENMGWNLVSLNTLVPFHYLFRVNWQPLVWIYHNAEQPRVRLQSYPPIMNRRMVHGKIKKFLHRDNHFSWNISFFLIFYLLLDKLVT